MGRRGGRSDLGLICTLLISYKAAYEQPNQKTDNLHTTFLHVHNLRLQIHFADKSPV